MFPNNFFKKITIHVPNKPNLYLSFNKIDGLNMLLQLLPRAGTDSELNSLIVTLI